MTLSEELKRTAQRLGFSLAGICPAVTPQGIHHFYQWLELGYAGSMDYLARRAAAYEHPRNVLPGARSLLMLGMNYHTIGRAAARRGAGQVSRYAYGQSDYHDVIHPRLQSLVQLIHQRVRDSRARGVVDTAPLLEREFAQLAGLGWIGKHTLLIHPRQGSWLFLAAVLTDVELDYDQPFATDHCGTCRACLDACPTQAFPQPYVLDASRCISYLTIELRESIPRELRESVGDWVFGCDVCQQVCPWNRRAPATDEPEFQPRTDLAPLELAELFAQSDAHFRQRFRATPLWRAKRRGLLRSAAIVLGNQRDAGAVEPLGKGLYDGEPLVRAACVWALRQMADPLGEALLQAHRPRETDPEVLSEYETE